MWPGLWQWFTASPNQKLFLTFLIGLVLGLIIGRMVRRHKEKKAKSFSRAGDEAFFRGIQYILSNEPDQAIEQFTKSVQVNSETIETYVALGNLYRSKGDIERAVRIRQSIILRPHIEEEIRIRALFDLGLDYRKGGFLNRALDAFKNVLDKQPSHLEALKATEKIYEELRDWENAFSTRQKIARHVKDDHGHILAHYQTEMGKSFAEKGEMSKAKACFQKALSIDDRCVDAHLHLGDLYFNKEDFKKAIAEWKRVVQVAPPFTFLAFNRLEGAYLKMKNLKPIEDFLKECSDANADAFTHMALARYLYNEHDTYGALRELQSALAIDPSFWEAVKFKGEILLSHGMKAEALAAYRDLISRLNVPYLKFQCSNCGFRPYDLQWQCPQCKGWDTITLMDSGRVDSVAPAQPPQAPAIAPAGMKPEEDV